MKKIIIITVIFLSFALMLTACANNNIASPKESVTPTPKPSERLSSDYIQLLKSERYSMKYRTFMDIEGNDKEAEITVVISGKEKAIKLEMDDFQNTTITKEELIYMINHDTKTVIVMPLSMPIPPTEENSMDPTTIDAFNIEYAESGTKEFLGNSREYEEYNTNEGKIFFYFDSGRLYGMEVLYEDNSFVMIIEEMTSNVDESIFEIPSDYETIKL